MGKNGKNADRETPEEPIRGGRWDNSSLTVETVGGNAWSYDASSLTVQTVEGKVYSESSTPMRFGVKI